VFTARSAASAGRCQQVKGKVAADEPPLTEFRYTQVSYHRPHYSTWLYVMTLRVSRVFTTAQ